MSGVTLAQPVQQTPSYAAPDTGGLDLGGAGSSLLRADTRLLAPGLKATSFDRLQDAGWVTGQVLVADLRTPGLTLDVRDSGSLTDPAPVSKHQLGDHAVAAVNGSFFDINNSGVAQGTNVSATDGLKTTSPSPVESFTMSNGLAAVRALSSAASVEIAGAQVRVGAVNSIDIPQDGLGYFTQMWGSYPISRAIGGPGAIDSRFLRVEILDGIVTRVSSSLAEITGTTQLGQGQGILLARGLAVEQLASVQVGDALPVTVAATENVDLAISGGSRLVTNGQVASTSPTGEPRTAAGVSADGATVYIVTLDGRQSHSRGMSLGELAEFLIELGAYNAVNLDGGGSTTMLLREPGNSELSVANAPSDGNLRSVPNSLVFSSTSPSAGVADVMVSPDSKLANANNVFPGLTRSVSGVGLDASLAVTPVAGEFQIGNDRATIAAIDGQHARVTGVTPGKSAVTFTAQGKSASTELRVLGELEQLRPSKTVVSLLDEHATAAIQITGVDRDGFTAPIDTHDIQVFADETVRVETSGPDAFTLIPNAASGATTVSFLAGKNRVDVPVTIGLEERPVTSLSDAASWTFASDRSTGAISEIVGPNGEAGLKLSYDFASSTGTRGAYAVAPAPILIEGQPQAVKMWMHGDGNSSWPRLQMRTGANTTINLDGEFTGWNGWKEVTFKVPVGTAYPLTMLRVRMMETSPAKQYQGETMFAGISAVVAPDVERPTPTIIHDPMVVTNGTVAQRAQKIAVMSDAQFVARTPDSANAQAARQTLREILAAKPEMFVITGDFVDEATPEDFALARRILDEEIGDKLPWVYVPGNHEVMGGPIQNFVDAFGPTKTKQVVGRTLIVTLNTAQGSFNRSDTSQLRFLESALKDAAADSTITGVLVFAHHPADDPKVSKDSQLSDRLEARKFQERLAEFRTDTGKSIAVINGHSGVFHASSNQGVSNLVTGNSGKSPSGTPGEGGFTGWAMLGINPGAGVVGADPTPVTSRVNWLQSEVKPRVDAVMLGASTPVPAQMTQGQTLRVDAAISQDNGRVVPVQWPMSAQWSGDSVVIDDGTVENNPNARVSLAAAETHQAAVLRFNPETGDLTATGPGFALLRLTVNGATVEQRIDVTAAPVIVPDPTDPATPGDPQSPQNPGTGGNTGSQTGSGAEQKSLERTGQSELIGFWLGGVALLLLGGGIVLGSQYRKRSSATR